MALLWLGCCLTCGEGGVDWLRKGSGKHLTPDALFLPNWACMLAASLLTVSFEYRVFRPQLGQEDNLSI